MERIRPLIAVLDDEPQVGKSLARLLKAHGFDVVTFTHGAEFLAATQSWLPNCLLLDLNMPGLDGFEVLERISTRHVPVIVITGRDQPGNVQRVRALGALNYFLKPVNEHELMDAIREAVQRPTGIEPDNTSRPR